MRELLLRETGDELDPRPPTPFVLPNANRQHPRNRVTLRVPIQMPAGWEQGRGHSLHHHPSAPG